MSLDPSSVKVKSSFKGIITGFENTIGKCVINVHILIHFLKDTSFSHCFGNWTQQMLLLMLVGLESALSLLIVSDYFSCTSEILYE